MRAKPKQRANRRRAPQSPERWFVVYGKTMAAAEKSASNSSDNDKNNSNNDRERVHSQQGVCGRWCGAKRVSVWAVKKRERL